MGTDIDWQHAPDTSFGSGHDVPAGHYVAVGRTAVRRRRAASVAIVAAMTVGVGAARASGPGTTPRGDAPIATQPASPHPDDPSEKSEKSDKSENAAQRERSLARMRDRARSLAVRFDDPAALTQDGEPVDSRRHERRQPLHR